MAEWPTKGLAQNQATTMGIQDYPHCRRAPIHADKQAGDIRYVALKGPEQIPRGNPNQKRDHNKGTQRHTQTSTKATDAPGERRDSDLTTETHVVGSSITFQATVDIDIQVHRSNEHSPG